jgi:RNA polymerase sigma-70 factor (ECF subfamily)
MSHSDNTQPLNEAYQQAFHELYQKHRRLVYSISPRLIQGVSESEDVTQDVFVHLFRTIRSYRGASVRSRPASPDL